MKNKKGFILSTYVYILLVFFLLLLGTMLAVLNNTRLLSNKLKEQSSNTSGLVNKDFSFVLLGDKETIIRKGEEFIDPGYIIKSSGGNDLSDIVKVTGSVNSDTLGIYELTYTATYNGVTKTISRNVEVVIPGPVSFEKDSWATIKAAVTAGNTDNYSVGDTKTVYLGSLGTHTVRIANNSHYVNKGECVDADGNELESKTACGFVIEFADIITDYNMNPSGTYNGTQYDYGWNKDGWPGSQMYDYINVTEKTGSGTIYNALVAAIGDIIIDTTVVSGHGSGDTSNFTSTDKLYLLSIEEVYGTSPSYDTSRGRSRQLDYYATYVNEDGTKGVTTSKYTGAKKQNGSSASNWWLRSVLSYTTGIFYLVNRYGNLDIDNAYNGYGVSPAFRLG